MILFNDMFPFEELFSTARYNACYSGRKPVAALLGPQEWLQMRKVLITWMGNDPRLEQMILTGEWEFQNLPVRLMRAPGVAILTEKCYSTKAGS